jgi:uncharacterized alkaline shock family protein YloU
MPMKKLRANKTNKTNKDKNMGKEITSLGSINIAPTAIASIVYQAALQSYGIVGLAPKNLAEGIASSITREPSRGVNVRFDDDKLDIDIFVIVEFGTRITTVSESVASAIRYQVEKTVGLKVHEVNVHVQGLRISNRD